MKEFFLDVHGNGCKDKGDMYSNWSHETCKTNPQRFIFTIKNNKIKYNSRKQLVTDKIFIPYEIEKNPKDFENTPISMLSAEEKIRELNMIVNDFNVNKKFLLLIIILNQKESNILKIVLQKFVNNNNGDHMNINDIINRLENELNSQVFFLNKF